MAEEKLPAGFSVEGDNIRIDPADRYKLREYFDEKRARARARSVDIWSDGKYSAIKQRQRQVELQDIMLERQFIQENISMMDKHIEQLESGVGDRRGVAKDIFIDMMKEGHKDARGRASNEASLARAMITGVLRASNGGAKNFMGDADEITSQARKLLADTITAGTDIAEVEAAMLDLASEMDTQTVAAIFEKALDIGGNLDPDSKDPDGTFQGADSEVLRQLKDLALDEDGNFSSDKLEQYIGAKVGDPDSLPEEIASKVTALGSGAGKDALAMLNALTENPELFEGFNIGGMANEISSALAASGNVQRGDYENAKEAAYDFAGARGMDEGVRSQIDSLYGLRAEQMRQLAATTPESSRPNLGAMKREIMQSPLWQVLPGDDDEKFRILNKLSAQSGRAENKYNRGLARDIIASQGEILDDQIRQNLEDAGMPTENLVTTTSVGRAGQYGAVESEGKPPTPGAALAGGASPETTQGEPTEGEAPKPTAKPAPEAKTTVQEAVAGTNIATAVPDAEMPDVKAVASKVLGTAEPKPEPANKLRDAAQHADDMLQKAGMDGAVEGKLFKEESTPVSARPGAPVTTTPNLGGKSSGRTNKDKDPNKRFKNKARDQVLGMASGDQ